ncbi:4'-phosphopantetheinyl transferase [Collybia nuda]|uniref:4'-phosphopantetheinyl transferase n=1 Tax=Collybia nuda TaxID=64659 RepID=A0A9P6CHR7_9AGAR|nr:4'-phosphopantetheinyl transferase [Collybia nuda]
MTILGIGVDVVHIPRFAALLNRRGSRQLATRILSLEEYAQWQSSSHSDPSHHARFFAVRWALKEAAYKAVYPVVRPTWKEFTYRGTGPGRVDPKPSLLYRPRIHADLSKVGLMHISVSHDGEYVFASVLVEGP